jgi:hypothetical protein
MITADAERRELCLHLTDERSGPRGRFIGVLPITGQELSRKSAYLGGARAGYDSGKDQAG